MSNLQIDWTFIEQSELQEGQNPLTFVHPSMNSGLTLGAGIDLKGKDVKYLKDIGVPPDVINKLKPYLGQTGEQARKTFLNLKDVEILTQPELDVLYSKVKEQFGKEIKNSYHQHTGKKFTDLDPKSQTALADIGWHEGSSLTRKGAVDPTTGEPERIPMNFVSQIANNDMTAALANLQDWNEGKKDDFVERHLRVRDLLKGDVSQGVIDKGIGVIADKYPFAKDFAVGVGDILDRTGDMARDIVDTFPLPAPVQETTPAIPEHVELDPTTGEPYPEETMGDRVGWLVGEAFQHANKTLDLNIEIEGTDEERAKEGLELNEDGSVKILPEDAQTELEQYYTKEGFKRPGKLLDMVTEDEPVSWEVSDLYLKRLTQKDFDDISDATKQKQLESFKGVGSAYGAAFRHNWVIPNYIESVLENKPKYDPEFELTEEILNTYMKDFPEDWWDEFLEAGSMSDMLTIRDRLLKQLERAKEIESLGVPGALTANLASWASDPTIVLGFAAAKMLLGKPSWEAILASKAKRLNEMIKSGVIVGTGIALPEVYLAHRRADLDTEDVIHAFLIAGALGSLFGLRMAKKYNQQGMLIRSQYPAISPIKLRRQVETSAVNEFTAATPTLFSKGKFNPKQPEIMKNIKDWKTLSKGEGVVILEKALGTYSGELSKGLPHGKGTLRVDMPESFIKGLGRKEAPIETAATTESTTALEIVGIWKNGKLVKNRTPHSATEINTYDDAARLVAPDGEGQLDAIQEQMYKNIIRNQDEQLAKATGQQVLKDSARKKVASVMEAPETKAIRERIAILESKLWLAKTTKESDIIAGQLTLLTDQFLKLTAKLKITKGDIKPITREGVEQLSSTGVPSRYHATYVPNFMVTPHGNFKKGVISTNSLGETILTHKRYNLTTNKTEVHRYVVGLQTVIPKEFTQALNKVKKQVTALEERLIVEKNKLDFFGVPAGKVAGIPVTGAEKATLAKFKEIEKAQTSVNILENRIAEAKKHIQVQEDTVVRTYNQNGHYRIKECR